MWLRLHLLTSKYTQIHKKHFFKCVEALLSVSSTHVAFPSRTKTQDSDSLSVASTTLTDSGFSFSVRSVWVGV